MKLNRYALAGVIFGLLFVLAAAGLATLTTTKAATLHITSAADVPAMPWASTEFESYVDLNLTDGETHYITFQFQDDGTRVTAVDVIDADTGLWLDAGMTFRNFAEPVYGTWECRGHLLFRIRKIEGADARVTGIFFDATPPTPVPPATPTPTPTPTATPTPTPTPKPSPTPGPCSARNPAGKCKKGCVCL